MCESKGINVAHAARGTLHDISVCHTSHARIITDTGLPIVSSSCFLSIDILFVTNLRRREMGARVGGWGADAGKAWEGGDTRSGRRLRETGHERYWSGRGKGQTRYIHLCIYVSKYLYLYLSVYLHTHTHVHYTHNHIHTGLNAI